MRQNSLRAERQPKVRYGLSPVVEGTGSNAEGLVLGFSNVAVLRASARNASINTTPCDSPPCWRKTRGEDTDEDEDEAEDEEDEETDDGSEGRGPKPRSERDGTPRVPNLDRSINPAEPPVETAEAPTEDDDDEDEEEDNKDDDLLSFCIACESRAPTASHLTAVAPTTRGGGGRFLGASSGLGGVPILERRFKND